MTSKQNELRLKYIDASRFVELAHYLIDGINRRKSIRPKRPQLNYRQLGGDNYVVACLLYALGYPLGEVSRALNDSAINYLQVFLLAGTEPAFPVKIATIEPGMPASSVVNLSELPDLRARDDKDYSMSNSKDGLRAVFSAWAAKDTVTGDRLASLIYDPPEATYIGPVSQVCTTDEQLLAYAVRDYVLGKIDASRMFSEELLNKNAVAAGVRMQASILSCLLTKSNAKEKLLVYLDWHRSEAQSKMNLDDPDFFLCTPALGLANLAMRAGHLSSKDAEIASPYFPYEMIIQ
jgi:hypothetical protein